MNDSMLFKIQNRAYSDAITQREVVITQRDISKLERIEDKVKELIRVKKSLLRMQERNDDLTEDKKEIFEIINDMKNKEIYYSQIDLLNKLNKIQSSEQVNDSTLSEVIGALEVYKNNLKNKNTPQSGIQIQP